MPPVGDDPVAQCARPAPRRPHHHHRHPPRTPELHRSPQNRNISKKNCSKKKLAKRRPGGPSGVAPLTDAAIAAAPNRIERKWNRRRRPGGGPNGSRCRPRARESMDKEEERAPPRNARGFDRAVGERPPTSRAHPPPPTTPAPPAPRRPHHRSPACRGRGSSRSGWRNLAPP